MTLHHILIIAFFLHSGLYAQHDAFSRSMGNNTSAVINQYSAFNNPAASVLHETNTIITATEVRHMVQKLAIHQAGVNVQKSNRAFGITLLHTGFSAFNQSRLSIHYGMLLNQSISVAIQLNAHHFTEPDRLGNAFALTPNVSLLYRLNETVTVGIVADNILRVKHPFGNEPIAQRMAIGGAWQLSQDFLFSCDAEMALPYPIGIGVGIEWSIMESVYIRTGLRHSPMINAIGMGYQTNKTHMDVAVSYMPLLGATPSLSLTHSW